MLRAASVASVIDRDLNDEQQQKAEPPTSVTEGGMIIEERDVQRLKAPNSIEVKDSGRTTDSRDGHRRKVMFPIDVIAVLDRSIDSSAEHVSNTRSPNDVILLGSSIFLRAEQPRNAFPPMDVIESGMITVVSSSNSFSTSSISSPSSSDFRFLNAPSSIIVKVPGMVQVVPSSERKSRALALVKTVILEEKDSGGKGVLVIDFKDNIDSSINNYAMIMVDW